MVIGKMLEKAGFNYEAVGEPKVALEKVNGTLYDLILMDYQLPGMVGSDIARIIRKNKNSSISETPILAMTASRKKEDIDDCLNAGMNGIVDKPTTIEVLKERIIKAVTDRKQSDQSKKAG